MKSNFMEYRTFLVNFFFLLVLINSLVNVSNAQRRGSSIGVGGGKNRGRSGITIGGSSSNRNSSRIGVGTNRGGSSSRGSFPSGRYPYNPSRPNGFFNESIEREEVNVGLVLPLSRFHERDYKRAMRNSISSIMKGRRLGDLTQRIKLEYDNVKLHMISISPSPQAILGTLCETFLSINVSAIMYLTNTELYGRSTAASQYFLQLTGYLGIPVIAWNADNSGLLRRASQTDLVLQLAPSVEHQASAMLSIMIRYNWHQFAIVTSQIAGHDDFVQAVRDRMLESESDFKFIILATVMVITKQDLASLVGSEARVLLLYCTREEAKYILDEATRLGLSGANYVWIATQSVIGNSLDAPNEFPVGMLGVHFNTSHDSLKSEISNTIKVFAHGTEAFRSDERNEGISLSPSISCEGLGKTAKWAVGDRFFPYLRNVSVPLDPPSGKPPLKFNPSGTLESVELEIMNLRPNSLNYNQLVWEQIGIWQSWHPPHGQLDIKDIVWPGYSHKPPDGVPEKFHLKIAFLEEAPYIKMANPDPVIGICSPDRGVLCRIAPDSEILGLNHTVAVRNSSFYQCCSGLCIDLLIKFAEDIGFTYELVRVEDSNFGTIVNGRWNGLIAELVNRKADVALASIMMNSERESVVDFSVPFMDSGIAILTAKRTGIISPTAFLEPFDADIWVLVCIVGIQIYTIAIFGFEWLSPLGFDMKKEAPANAKFSLCRSLWLVWARLFQASVHIDAPRGFTAKFVVHVWSMFAVVFLATYTANLAVFMITREESHEFVGIHDPRLSNPQSVQPPLHFGTVPFSHTDTLLEKHHPEMHLHMKKYMKNNVTEGVSAIRKGELDAFIYDGPVIQYEEYQDNSDTCQLLIEGTWYAHTGYGIAFPRHSKYLPVFNRMLMTYKENGDLERLKRFYFTGPCSPESRGHRSSMDQSQSQPLALEQFLSAFFLLMLGVAVAFFILILERTYSQYIQTRKADSTPGCLTLCSRNLARLYNYPWGFGYDSRIGHLRPGTSGFRSCSSSFSVQPYPCECKNPVCNTNLLRSQHRLKLVINRCQFLENRLQALAVVSRKKRSSCWPGESKPASLSDITFASIIGSPRELTRSDVPLEPDDNQALAFRYREHLYRPSLTEIAEIETVL